MGFFGDSDLDRAKRQARSYESVEAFLEEKREEAQKDPVEVPDYEYDRVLTLEDLQTEFRWRFEFSLYAAVDDDGWHGQGEMGWFGVSSETSDERADWFKSFYQKFIGSRDPETIVAVLDCHV